MSKGARRKFNDPAQQLQKIQLSAGARKTIEDLRKMRMGKPKTHKDAVDKARQFGWNKGVLTEITKDYFPGKITEVVIWRKVQGGYIFSGTEGGNPFAQEYNDFKPKEPPKPPTAEDWANDWLNDHEA